MNIYLYDRFDFHILLIFLYLLLGSTIICHRLFTEGSMLPIETQSL